MSKAPTWLRRALLVATVALAAAGPNVSPVYAQSSNNQALIEQVNRLQRELSTLQLYVYRGEKPPESAIAEIYGLPLNFLDKRNEDMLAITVEDIQRVAQTYLHPDALYIVIVSSLADIEEQLKGYGKIHVTEIEK